MTPAQQAALDEALRALRDIARAEGLRGVGVLVQSDGRVRVDGLGGYGARFVAWSAHADLEPGGPLPTPGAALAERGGR